MTDYRNRLLSRVIAPAAEPITLAEAKLYLRINGEEESDLIGNLIIAARESAEEILSKSLIIQSWKLAFDDYVDDEIALPRGPVIAITSVQIIESDGDVITIDPATYCLNAAKNVLILGTGYDGQRVEIVYSAGYGNAAAVPMPIKQGMLAHIAALYDARGEMGGDLPQQTMRLYLPFREVRL